MLSAPLIYACMLICRVYNLTFAFGKNYAYRVPHTHTHTHTHTVTGFSVVVCWCSLWALCQQSAISLSPVTQNAVELVRKVQFIATVVNDGRSRDKLCTNTSSRRRMAEWMAMQAGRIFFFLGTRCTFAFAIYLFREISFRKRARDRLRV